MLTSVKSALTKHLKSYTSLSRLKANMTLLFKSLEVFFSAVIFKKKKGVMYTYIFDDRFGYTCMVTLKSMLTISFEK